MSLLLFLAILALATCATVALRHVERLAKSGEHENHRRAAYGFLVALVVVVAALEGLLFTKTISFSIPARLYEIHVVVAAMTGVIFLTKMATALVGFFAFHIWLSKPLWVFWWLTVSTATLIGIWNLARA